MKNRMFAACAALMAMAACGDGGSRGLEGAAEGEGTGEAQPSIHAGLSWAVQVGGSGISITLVEPAGAPLLRLACTRSPARMTIEVDGFQPIGSEERLSFGVDDESFVFVADPSAARPTGVQAETTIDPELLERLRRATAVQAVYGAQQLGPYMPPDEDASAQFVRVCQQIRSE